MVMGECEEYGLGFGCRRVGDLFDRARERGWFEMTNVDHEAFLEGDWVARSRCGTRSMVGESRLGRISRARRAGRRRVGAGRSRGSSRGVRSSSSRFENRGRRNRNRGRVSAREVVVGVNDRRRISWFTTGSTDLLPVTPLVALQAASHGFRVETWRFAYEDGETFQTLAYV